MNTYPECQKIKNTFIMHLANRMTELRKLPQTELVAEKGYEILYFTEDIDEFAIKMLVNYKEKEFKSVSSGDLGIESDDEQNQC